MRERALTAMNMSFNDDDNCDGEREVEKILSMMVRARGCVVRLDRIKLETELLERGGSTKLKEEKGREVEL